MKFKHIIIMGCLLGIAQNISISNNVHAEVSLNMQEVLDVKRMDLSEVIVDFKKNIGSKLSSNYLSNSNTLLAYSNLQMLNGVQQVFVFDKFLNNDFRVDIHKEFELLESLFKGFDLNNKIFLNNNIVELYKYYEYLINYENILAQQDAKYVRYDHSEFERLLPLLLLDRSVYKVDGLSSIFQFNNPNLLKAKSEEKANLIREEQERKKKEGFIVPISNAKVTSRYGEVRSLLLQDGRTKRDVHSGIDYINGNPRADILASKSGVVVFVGWRTGYGNTVVIRHDGDIYTLYAHLSSMGVSEGQVVEQAQVIGKMGSTGDSTGSHLHFGMAVGNMYNIVDPNNYLNK